MSRYHYEGSGHTKTTMQVEYLGQTYFVEASAAYHASCDRFIDGSPDESFGTTEPDLDDIYILDGEEEVPVSRGSKIYDYVIGLVFNGDLRSELESQLEANAG
jgi:hypothetical protein